jgi:hypothetical protein
MPVIPELGRLRQQDHKFEASLGQSECLTHKKKINKNKKEREM